MLLATWGCVCRMCFWVLEQPSKSGYHDPTISSILKLGGQKNKDRQLFYVGIHKIQYRGLCAVQNY